MLSCGVWPGIWASHLGQSGQVVIMHHRLKLASAWNGEPQDTMALPESFSGPTSSNARDAASWTMDEG